MKSTAAIYDLLVSEYDERMFHLIPTTKSVTRHKWIEEQCNGEHVLDVGGSGYLAEIIKRVAKSHSTVDKQNADYCVNLDKEPIPIVGGTTLVVCGEVVEHLSNPGFFLDGLRLYHVPVIFTVPNAFAAIGRRHIMRGMENVNADHVAYYSHYTFKNLLQRHGFEVERFLWYNGQPGISEGLIFKAR